MSGLFLIAATASLLGSGLLWMRFRAADTGGAMIAPRGPLGEALLRALGSSASSGEDTVWSLGEATSQDLGPVLTALDDRPRARTLAEAEEEAEQVLRLLQPLDLAPATEDEVLAPLLEHFRSLTFLDRPIATVERVRPGELVDRQRMVTLTPGTHVRRALGFVLKTADGRVVSRAKVSCD